MVSPKERARPEAGSDGGPGSEGTFAHWAGWGLFAAALVAGIWLRWRVYTPATTSDELALALPIWHHGRFFDNPEWARNPPLVPLLLSWLPSALAIKEAGRVLVALCGFAAAIPAFFAARRMSGGNMIVGAVAAALVTLNPILVSEGLTYRLYGVWSLVETWRLACLCSLIAAGTGTPDRRLWRTFLTLTILLPWTHYSSMIFLAVEGPLLWLLLPQLRYILRAHLLSALCLTPAIAAIFYFHNSPAPIGDALRRASIAWLGGWWAEQGSAVNTALAGALLFGILATLLHRDLLVFRGLAAHALSLLTLWPIAATVMVRPAIGALGAPTFAVLFPSLVTLLAAHATRRAVAAICGGALLVELLAPLPLYSPSTRHLLILTAVITTALVLRRVPTASLLALVVSLVVWFGLARPPWNVDPDRGYGVGRGDIDRFAFATDFRAATSIEWNVYPSWVLNTLRFDFAQTHLPVGECGYGFPFVSEPAPLADFHESGPAVWNSWNGNCFTSGAARFSQVADLTRPPTGNLLVLSCDEEPPTCTPLRGRPCARTYECP